ncbi:MAG TPA: FliH/SctL family protein [Solirubrobacteraceae bacterium]|nr:FliH/SctL family protein [Solirubrobacteraceae bacterium]
MSSSAYSAFGFEQLEPSYPSGDPESAFATLRDEAEAAIAAARTEAHAEGIAEGEARVRAELAPALAALEAAGTELEQARALVTDGVERHAVELALTLAERIVAAAIDVEPERVLDVVSGALRGLVERERVTVLVHPDDLALVTGAADGIAVELGGIVRLDTQAERRVPRGGAVLRTDLCEIDATARAKLDRAEAVLIAELGR